MVDMGRMAGPVKAWWYDPRNGHAHFAGEFTNQGAQSFTSPLGGPDWVLVLDEAAQNFPPPGVRG